MFLNMEESAVAKTIKMIGVALFGGAAFASLGSAQSVSPNNYPASAVIKAFKLACSDTNTVEELK